MGVDDFDFEEDWKWIVRAFLAFAAIALLILLVMIGLLFLKP